MRVVDVLCVPAIAFVGGGAITPLSAARVILMSPKTSCVNLLWVAVGGWLSSASRSARAGRPLGDSGAGHPLGGSEVGHGARRAGDGDGDVAL